MKNLTHGDTFGRVAVKIGVAYDSDVDRVQELLLDCAKAHPHVLQSPLPRVFLMAFGDKALEFELRCFVANVAYSLEVRSDLAFAILHALRGAKIGIPTNPAEFGARRPAAEPPAVAGHKSGAS